MLRLIIHTYTFSEHTNFHIYVPIYTFLFLRKHQVGVDGNNLFKRLCLCEIAFGHGLVRIGRFIMGFAALQFNLIYWSTSAIEC